MPPAQRVRLGVPVHVRRRRELRQQVKGTYIDLNELFNPLRNSDMLIPTRRDRHDRHIPSANPTPLPIRVREESLRVRGWVVEVSQHDGVGLHEQLSLLIVCGDLGAVGSYDLDCEAWEQMS